MNEIAIRTENLSKSFGNVKAVDNLNLEVKKGEILGFLGPNGAGKTTSINMMVGLIKPGAGNVYIFGNRNISNKLIKAHVGVCPQEVILWKRLNCLEQLEFMGEMYGMSRKKARARSEELIEVMGLSEHKYKVARNLSGGMQRRLNLMLAMVHDPEILVLDEPEAGLDPQSRIMVRDYIKSMARDKTIIITTHNMDEADRVADKVAIIDHGKLLLLDTPEALKKSIGEGDILELELTSDSGYKTEDAVSLISNMIPMVTYTQNSLILKHINIVEKISQITDILNRSGYRIGQMHLRENTLEDVFIHLTGRRLRQ